MPTPYPLPSVVHFASLLLVTAAASMAPRHSYGEAAGKITLPPGFRAELVHEVPAETEGSWVALTADDRGRLIASDQHGALYRITPSPLGGDPAHTKVEKLSVQLGMAQGLLFHKGQLYVVVNGEFGSFSSGLYRVSDSNNDDKFDRIEQLRVFGGAGEHGPHGIVLGPDGNSLYIVCGNHTDPPLYSSTAVPPRWREDQLLPLITDPNGHAANIRAPGGWFAKMDLNGGNLELFSIGYRNCYDLAFNEAGDLFTYDSDMEWDIGTPWYRPTRICHVTSGSDFGWRTGNSVWPAYYIDSVPGAVDTGPGSPTGVVFGAGSKFPEKYQKALFAADWSYGNIYAVFLEPTGSSYTGSAERFAFAMPLGVTDMVVRPEDGALYFAVGGRKSASALYRIVWTGEGLSADAAEPEVVAATDPERIFGAGSPAPPTAEARAVRRSLEKLNRSSGPEAIDQIWPHLGNSDRFIKNVARTALEHQPFERWRDRALAEKDVDAKLNALAAFARTADSGQQMAWVNALAAITFPELNVQQQLDYLRVASLGVMRLDPIQPATREKLLSALDPYLPSSQSHAVNRDLGNLLIRLRAPGIVDRLVPLMENAATPEDGIDFAVSLTAVQDGWTIENRIKLLDWFERAARSGGGHSFFGYLVSARDRYIANIPAADRRPIADRISKPLVEQTAQIEVASRPLVKEWTLDEVTQLVEQDKSPRSFENGRKMFSAAGCYNCHRVAGAGSSIGPDLTGLGGRFGAGDILRSVIDPNHTISDQYQQMVFETNGRMIVGRVSNINNDNIMVSTNMLDPKKTEAIPRDELDDQYPSDVSMMPSGLLNTLTAEEILDLTAFLRSGGKADHELFKAEGGN
jgi:putative heme-binding domain-containing protein